jgi:hypothetical protein
MFDEIVKRSHVLTPENFDAYEKLLKQRVRNYVPQFPDS